MRCCHWNDLRFTRFYYSASAISYNLLSLIAKKKSSKYESVTYLVANTSSLRRYNSAGSVCCRHKYSATCRAGNSVSQTYPKSRAKCMASPENEKKSWKKKKIEASPITPRRLFLISHDDSLTVVLCKLSLCLMSGKKKKEKGKKLSKGVNGGHMSNRPIRLVKRATLLLSKSRLLLLLNVKRKWAFLL